MPARVIFAGTPEFAVPSLQALVSHPRVQVVAVLTQPDRPAGRGRRLRASPVKACARNLDLPVETFRSLRGRETRAHLAGMQPELMVVAAYGLILPAEVLTIPALGCVNVHASLLPRWRGAAPIQRAIQAGDRQTGITIMQMDAGLDTGDMLLSRALPIGPRETAGRLHDRLADLGAVALVEALPGILDRQIKPVPQDASRATYAGKLDKAEAWVDWTLDSASLDRLIRAFNPWPVAQTRWRGRQLRIWAAEPASLPDPGQPGRVMHADEGEPLVATGDGALRLQEVQLAGSRRMSAAAFLRAHSMLGDELGAGSN